MYTYDMLISPVSDAQPCGPDLDLAGDADFLNFTAFAESVLPASYFRFDRSEVDIAGQITAMKPLLQRTRDVRLLVILAKYSILNRQFQPFVDAIRALGTLVAEHWQEVNPQGEDGDFALRIATLESLDDMAQVILPLQHQGLFRSRKTGAVSFRTHLIASGGLAPREGEEAFDSGTLEQAIGEADIREIITSRDSIAQVKEGLTRIQNGTREGMDFQGSVSLERLVPLVNDIFAFLEGIVARRDPASASGAAAQGEEQATQGETTAGGATFTMVAPPPGALVSLSEVDAALKALGRYYGLKEPSSPALMLVRQAQSLVGKNFFDGIRALMPAHASEAVLVMGAKPGFDLAIERLAEVAAEFPPEETEEVSSESDRGWENSESEESWDNTRNSDQYVDPDSAGTDSSDEEGTSGDQTGTEDSLAEETLSAPVTQHEPPLEATPPQGPRRFSISHRPEAFALITAVQEYYARVEPASPIPLLLDRARNVGTLDFVALMRLVMPSRAFRSEDE